MIGPQFPPNALEAKEPFDTLGALELHGPFLAVGACTRGLPCTLVLEGLGLLPSNALALGCDDWRPAGSASGAEASFPLGTPTDSPGEYSLCWRHDASVPFALPAGELVVAPPPAARGGCVWGGGAGVGTHGRNPNWSIASAFD